MNNIERGNANYETIGDCSHQILEHTWHDDIVLHIYGYKYNSILSFLFHAIAILLLGIPYLICKWYPQTKVCKYKRCTLKNADVILVVDNYDHTSILPVFNENVLHSNTQIKYFNYQHVKYVWKNNETQFAPLKFPDDNFTLNSILDDSHGLTREEQENMVKIYGSNVMDIEVKSYLKLFVDEILNPFYLFQIFSIILWSFDEYYYYAGCVLFLSLISIITSLYETRKQSLALRNLVGASASSIVEVCRPIQQNKDEFNKFTHEKIESAKVAPNDVIVIPQNGCIMSCDAVLLSGICIVNESMLTGESVPVTKTPPAHSTETYNIDLHKRHTIFAGTHVIQTRYYGGNKVLARVVRTGFNTSKGELVKSILYPKPTGLQFYKDAMKFVLFLSIIAAAGMAYCVYLYIDRKAELEEIIIRALDVVTVVVPPALPAAMTVGTIYSQNRLKTHNIFCISPPRINVCGKLKLICFDKTGTLTHDGLEFYGVLPCKQNRFEYLSQEPWTLDQNSYVIQAMVTCHSLTRIDNALTGDPLDLSMFEATRWDLEEAGSENTRYDMLTPTVVRPSFNVQRPKQVDELYELPYEIGIIRQFPFSSSQQCMSVICRVLGEFNMTVFVKGAPEKIQALCKPSSVPSDFSTVLLNYTTSGYRVIALAYKNLSQKMKWKEAQKVKRDFIECDLVFLGFIVMQNSLKPETIPVINELHSAKIRTVMITGDNVMTAVSVSRDCGMVLPNENIALLESVQAENGQIPKLTVEILGLGAQQNGDCMLDIDHKYHIALDGRTWSVVRTHYPQIIPALVLRGTIFARFRPEQKTQLILSLQEVDYIVAMCGDGANDCGALKAAHIGVSLSQAEASVAAPFTSATQNISCIKHLVQEGRCALVTSFSIFKYMALYSLIQFFTILILYQRYTTLGNMQFLYIDLIIITTLAVTMGYQGPANIIVPKRPTGSLVSLVNLIPLILQIMLCGIIQYSALLYLSLQPWFVPLGKSSYHGEEVIACWENTVIFTVSCYQYIILACVYSKGHPYRQSIFRNGYLIITVIVLTAFTTLLLIYPFEPLASFFEMIPCSKLLDELVFRIEIMSFGVIHLCLAFMIEKFIGEQPYLKTIAHFLTRKKSPKNKYKSIDRSLDTNNFLDNLRNYQHVINC